MNAADLSRRALISPDTIAALTGLPERGVRLGRRRRRCPNEVLTQVVALRAETRPADICERLNATFTAPAAAFTAPAAAFTAPAAASPAPVLGGEE